MTVETPELRALLTAAIRRSGGDISDIDDYERASGRPCRRIGRRTRRRKSGRRCGRATSCRPGHLRTDHLPDVLGGVRARSIVRATRRRRRRARTGCDDLPHQNSFDRGRCGLGPPALPPRLTHPSNEAAPNRQSGENLAVVIAPELRHVGRIGVFYENRTAARSTCLQLDRAGRPWLRFQTALQDSFSCSVDL